MPRELPPIRTWAGALPDRDLWDAVVLIGDCEDWLKRLPLQAFTVAMSRPFMGPAQADKWTDLLVARDRVWRVLKLLRPLMLSPSVCYMAVEWQTACLLQCGVDVYNGRPPHYGNADGLIARGWHLEPSLIWLSVRVRPTPNTYPTGAKLVMDHWSERRICEEICQLTVGDFIQTNEFARFLCSPYDKRAIGLPLDLAKELVRYSVGRRIRTPILVDPFAGDGSAGEAALAAGGKAVLIEKVITGRMTQWIGARKRAGSKVVVYQLPQ